MNATDVKTGHVYKYREAYVYVAARVDAGYFVARMFETLEEIMCYMLVNAGKAYPLVEYRRIEDCLDFLTVAELVNEH